MKVSKAVGLLCIFALSASCAGKSEGGEDDLAPPQPSSAPDDDEAPDDVAGERAPEAGEPGPEDAVEEGLAEDRVLVALDKYCGACHERPSDADTNAEPGPLEFTDDIDRMVALGVIIPFNGAFSLPVQVMVDGSMPPPDFAPRPTESEIDMIRAFIDDPRLWPEPAPVE